jgi:hypothetical protein
MGATHIRLKLASEDILTGALLAAYNLRRQKNEATRKPRKSPRKQPS